MSSVLSATKQIPANAGYFITLSSIANCIYQNDGTDAAPVINIHENAQALNAPGKVLRDHGKTLISSARVFRKVQVMDAFGATGAVENGGTDGVTQVGVNNYLTGYIELPGQGTGSGSGAVTPVARLG